ncbi:hypothetical protein [Maricaulis sp.]|uniref:hypothetical protein n=1 Tax=Maricaulis sp. TaxID=1486257 RepID=UPI003A944564
MSTDYKPNRFSSTFDNDGGKDIWAFLNQPDNIIRMETATYLVRTAAEPLSPFLLSRFGDDIRAPRLKQMIGHMIRQIMESRGYHVDRNNVRITTTDNMFTSATRYMAGAQIESRE